MTALRHDQDTEVTEAIEAAAHAACEVLDSAFPGHDNGGITSNFQGLLAEVLAHMLKGRSVLDSQRGHFIQLSALVIDGAFFGNPLARGEAFLVTKEGSEQWGAVGTGLHGGCKPLGRELLALSPDSKTFRPIAEASDAWTSFEAAAGQALDYLRAEELTLEQARELGLRVRAVVADQARERGHVLSDVALRLAA